jgi:SAM-dependent methyltransferase
MIAELIAAAGLLGGTIIPPAGEVSSQELRSAPSAPSPSIRPQPAQPDTKPAPPTSAAPTTPTTPTSSLAPKDGAAVVAQLVAEAQKLAPLMESDATREFLAEAKDLPVVETRTVYRKPGAAIPADAWEKLPEQERAAYTPRPCTPEFYYYTGYGSPLVYARVVDLMARHAGWGVDSLAGKRVLDFGYGTIGHLRLMAQRGAEVHGIEIEPLFEALYTSARDLRARTAEQAVFLHTGQWPASAELAEQVVTRGGGGAFDVITSKNTLKKGYVHPEPPTGKTVDEKQLVKLGVDDGDFLAAVHAALKPGGLLIIYNICPAQSPAEDLSKPYLPMADGRSPFTRAQYEAAGFEVLELDRDDQPWVLACWKALGYDQGKAKEDAAKEVFAHYTVVRRK